jgi:hypothetical protein
LWSFRKGEVGKMNNDLEYFLSKILGRLEGSFVCVLGDRKEEFDSKEAFMRSDFEKRCDLSSIRVEDGMVVLELNKLPPANDMNAPWIQEYIKKNGREPNFFD